MVFPSRPELIPFVSGLRVVLGRVCGDAARQRRGVSRGLRRVLVRTFGFGCDVSLGLVVLVLARPNGVVRRMDA